MRYLAGRFGICSLREDGAVFGKATDSEGVEVLEEIQVLEGGPLEHFDAVDPFDPIALR